MDIVLGVSLAPASVQMVLLQGENADGTTVDTNEFAVTADDGSPTDSASDRVLAAILATREDAASAGLELSAVGVACTDHLEAAALRDALTAHKMENVMLVSAFLAATALTQSVGGAMGYEQTVMFLVEPDTATLAVVETSDGSVADVHQGSTAELLKLVAELDELPTRPGGVFLVGRDVDIATLKSDLEAATSLTVSAPEEPETALARGAALASANAPLFASSTAALAYALDPGEPGEDRLAYGAATDDEASAPTVVIAGRLRRRPVLLVGTTLAVAGISAVIALEVAMTLGVHTTVGMLPAPLRGIIAPFQPATAAPPPAPVAATNAVAPKPLSPPAVAPPPEAPIPAAPVPAAPAVPVPVVLPPIVQAPVPPVHLPDPPASPPVVVTPPHQSPPAEPPPIHVPPPVHVPPPHLPPPHAIPPGQGPWPNPGGHGAPHGNPGGGGPVNGPGPVHGTPRGVGPDGGGPVNGPGPGHGTPAGGPPEGGTPPSTGTPPEHGGPLGGGEAPSGGAPSDHGGPIGGSETPSGGAPSVGSEPSSGGAPSVGSEGSSGSASSGGAESGGHR